MRVLPVIVVTATVLSLSTPLSLPAAQGVYDFHAETAPYNQEVYGPLAEIAPYNQKSVSVREHGLITDLVTTYEQDLETQVIKESSEMDALIVKQEMSRRVLDKI